MKQNYYINEKEMLEQTCITSYEFIPKSRKILCIETISSI